MNNENTSGNMKKIQFYICSICGNIITALGEGAFYAWCNRHELFTPPSEKGENKVWI